MTIEQLAEAKHSKPISAGCINPLSVIRFKKYHYGSPLALLVTRVVSYDTTTGCYEFEGFKVINSNFINPVPQRVQVNTDSEQPLWVGNISHLTVTDGCANEVMLTTDIYM